MQFWKLSKRAKGMLWKLAGRGLASSKDELLSKDLPSPVLSPFPQSPDRQIRVFISSTFHDMHAERDMLVKKIFPQLRKLCEERAVTWTEVDLRWGITDEQKAEGKVLPLCLEEIHRCTCFIGLLGERYGRIVKSIPKDLMESQPWLKDHLQSSVTELEILSGFLGTKSKHARGYVYFRAPDYLRKIPVEQRQHFLPENSKSAEKLRRLKDKIRASHHEQICLLREGYSDLEQLGAWILEDFTFLINTLYPASAVPDLLDQEAARQEAYARSRRFGFIGREDLIGALDEYASAGGQPLIVTGESGCGKSALLAEWVARWREQSPDDLLIQHYTGGTAESADWQRLIARIIDELKRAFAIPDPVPIGAVSLRTALHYWLAKAARSRRVILVLDAINQLTAERASKLDWLPADIPHNFRLIVSSLPGESLEVLRSRGWSELQVRLFTRAEIMPAIRAYLNIFSKTLPQGILETLQSASAACNALYLRALLDELRQFGNHEALKAKTDHYLAAPDLPNLFVRILIRWEEDFGAQFVQQSLCLIWAARGGLSEYELTELLDTRGQALPHALWAPFYLAAEASLAQRLGLLTFGHDYLRKAVAARYLPDDSNQIPFHKQIAGRLRSRVESLLKSRNSQDRGTPNDKRILSEYLYHLLRAGAGVEFYELCRNRKYWMTRVEMNADLLDVGEQLEHFVNVHPKWRTGIPLQDYIAGFAHSVYPGDYGPRSGNLLLGLHNIRLALEQSKAPFSNVAAIILGNIEMRTSGTEKPIGVLIPPALNKFNEPERVHCRDCQSPLHKVQDNDNAVAMLEERGVLRKNNPPGEDKDIWICLKCGWWTSEWLSRCPECNYFGLNEFDQPSGGFILVCPRCGWEDVF